MWIWSTSLKSHERGVLNFIVQYAYLLPPPRSPSQIPFGPLAYFSGQLIHTNDITQTLPTTPLDSTTPAVEGGGQEEDWEQGDSWKILKSAKQARESVRKQSAGASFGVFALRVGMVLMGLTFVLCRGGRETISFGEGD